MRNYLLILADNILPWQDLKTGWARLGWPGLGKHKFLTLKASRLKSIRVRPLNYWYFCKVNMNAKLKTLLFLYLLGVGRWLEGTNCLRVTVMFEVFEMIFHPPLPTVTSDEMRGRGRWDKFRIVTNALTNWRWCDVQNLMMINNIDWPEWSSQTSIRLITKYIIPSKISNHQLVDNFYLSLEIFWH